MCQLRDPERRRLRAVRVGVRRPPCAVGVQRLAPILSIVGGRVFFREEDFARRLAAGALILAGAFLIAVTLR